MTLTQLKASDRVDLADMDLKVTDYESILDVYVDKRGHWVYNLNNRMAVEADGVVEDYLVVCDQHWTTVSYNIYTTTRLAWLLMQVNHVKPEDVFKPVLAGTTVKYLPHQHLSEVIAAMSNSWGE